MNFINFTTRKTSDCIRNRGDGLQEFGGRNHSHLPLLWQRTVRSGHTLATRNTSGSEEQQARARRCRQALLGTEKPGSCLPAPLPSPRSHSVTDSSDFPTVGTALIHGSLQARTRSSFKGWVPGKPRSPTWVTDTGSEKMRKKLPRDPCSCRQY